MGIHQFMDWNSMVQQILTLITNKNLTDCSILKECATLLYVILAKHRKPQTFIQFKGLSLCFELIDRIIKNPDFLTHSIKTEWEESKCVEIVSSSFNHHMISQYTQQHLVSKLLECSMQSIRLSRQPQQYLREPLVALTMVHLIRKCYVRPKQTLKPSQSFTKKEADIDKNKNKNNDTNDDDKDNKDDKDDNDDNDATMTETNNSNNDNNNNTMNVETTTTTEQDGKTDDNDNENRSRPFSDIANKTTPPPPSKRQKNKESIPQMVLPIVPTPTEHYGHEVYQITCKMIAACIQNGAGLGVGKIFHEYGVTQTFVTSLTKVCLLKILCYFFCLCPYLCPVFI